jgi:hypothetical protein
MLLTTRILKHGNRRLQPSQIIAPTLNMLSQLLVLALSLSLLALSSSFQFVPSFRQARSLSNSMLHAEAMAPCDIAVTLKSVSCLYLVRVRPTVAYQQSSHVEVKIAPPLLLPALPPRPIRIGERHYIKYAAGGCFCRHKSWSGS